MTSFLNGMYDLLEEVGAFDEAVAMLRKPLAQRIKQKGKPPTPQERTAIAREKMQAKKSARMASKEAARFKHLQRVARKKPGIQKAQKRLVFRKKLSKSMGPGSEGHSL